MEGVGASRLDHADDFTERGFVGGRLGRHRLGSGRFPALRFAGVFAHCHLNSWFTIVERLGKDNVRRGVEEARVNGGDRLVGLIEQGVAAQNLHEFVGERGGGDFHLFGRALELVDLALELEEPGAADGLPGGFDEVLFLVADKWQAEDPRGRWGRSCRYICGGRDSRCG